MPGSSLSFRLPALAVWLSFGLRKPVLLWAGRGSRGLTQLEEAVPSRAQDIMQARAERTAMSTVIIEMDPHKRSATIGVMDSDESVLGRGWYGMRPATAR